MAKETTVASLETRYARVAIYVSKPYIASVGRAADTSEVFAWMALASASCRRRSALLWSVEQLGATMSCL